MRQKPAYSSSLGLLVIRSTVSYSVQSRSADQYTWALYLYSLLLGLVSSCLVGCSLDIGTKHCTLAEFYHGHRDSRSVIGTAAASVTIGVFDDWLGVLNCPGSGYGFQTSSRLLINLSSQVIKLDLKDPRTNIYIILLVTRSRPENVSK